MSISCWSLQGWAGFDLVEEVILEVLRLIAALPESALKLFKPRDAWQKPACAFRFLSTLSHQQSTPFKQIARFIPHNTTGVSLIAKSLRRLALGRLGIQEAIHKPLRGASLTLVCPSSPTNTWQIWPQSAPCRRNLRLC